MGRAVGMGRRRIAGCTPALRLSFGCVARSISKVSGSEADLREKTDGEEGEEGGREVQSAQGR